MDVCILPPKYSARSVNWPRIAFWGEGIYFMHDGYIPNINIGFFPAILWLWSVLWADWHKDTWFLNIFIHSVKYDIYIYIFLIMEYCLEISLMMSVIFYFNLYVFLEYFLFVFLKQYIKLRYRFLHHWIILPETFICNFFTIVLLF